MRDQDANSLELYCDRPLGQRTDEHGKPFFTKQRTFAPDDSLEKAGIT